MTEEVKSKSLIPVLYRLSMGSLWTVHLYWEGCLLLLDSRDDIPL